nr:RNA-directed DNA polymerase, eukaryota, reverse transcriptase zinc-binding domain protein [Tanacetum cinerariifolium]
MTTNFGKLDKFEGHDFRAKWENDDYICRGHILNGMSDSLFDVYTNVESAKELWDSFESKYMAEDSSSKKFLDFKHTLKHGKDDLSLVQLGSHLCIEESLRAQDSDKGKGKKVGGPSVNMTEEGGKNKHHKQNKGKKRSNENTSGSRSNKKPKLECWKCGKTGHFKRDCRSGKKNNANAVGSGKASKDQSQDQGQNLVPVWNRFIKFFVSLISEAFYVQVDAIAWWIDSGATTHVCKDRCWFKTFELVEDGFVLYMGDEHFAPVHGKGSVAIEFSSGKTITLFNVLYVPKLRKNLVSGPVLNKCGYKQVYESDKYILSKCGVFVGFGYYNNGMFILNLNKVPDNSDSVYMSFSSTVVNTSLWHARLGHVHYKIMLETSKDEFIPAIDENSEKCTTCNKKFVVTFIDYASRFCYVYLLHAKDEALDKFRIYKTEVELQQNDLIKTLRTDRGGEYYDPVFFQSVRVIHETTAPYTPRLNGVAEKKNIALKEMDKSDKGMRNRAGKENGCEGVDGNLTGIQFSPMNGMVENRDEDIEGKKGCLGNGSNCKNDSAKSDDCVEVGNEGDDSSNNEFETKFNDKDEEVVKKENVSSQYSGSKETNNRAEKSLADIVKSNSGEKCSIDMYMDKTEPKRILVWVKIRNVPMKAWSVKGIRALASSIGKPVIMDEITTRMCVTEVGRIGFARVLVEIDAEKGIKDKIEILYKSKSITKRTKKIVDVEYSWIPCICSQRKVFGHIDNDCKTGGRSRNTKDTEKENQQGSTSVDNSNRNGILRMIVDEFLSKKNDDNNVGMNGWTKEMKRYYRDIKELFNAAKEIERNKDVMEEDCDEGSNVLRNKVDVKDLEMQKIITNGQPWIILGDFNVTLKVSEYSNESAYLTSEMAELQDCVNNIEIKKIFLPNVRIVWNKNFKGHTMYRIVQKMKTLKRKLKQISWKNGNVFERVEKLRIEVKKCQNDVDRIKPEEALKMVRPISDSKINNALFEIEDSKAPVREFFLTGKLLGEVSANLITLVPKVPTPDKISHFRPITCCNVLYKCISKILTSKIKGLLGTLVDKNQSAFIGGRQITDNILLSQELFRGYNMKQNIKKVPLKVNLQKAHDTISWEFIKEVLGMFGVHETMVNRIITCVTSTKLSINVNGERVSYFKGSRGLRQGDLISPDLFTIVMEVLNLLIKKNIEENMGFKYHFGCKNLKITHLCFADDLLVLCHGDFDSVKVIKKSLDEFSGYTGLLPNMQKSTIFLGGLSSAEKQNILNIIPFTEGKFLVRYLGVPLIIKQLSISDCKPLVNKVQTKISDWKNKSLSYDGMVQLIASILSSMQNYWAFVFLLPKQAIYEINKLLKGFLWCQGELTKGKAKIQVPILRDDIEDTAVCILGNGHEKNFKISNVWMDMNWNETKVEWHTLVWFAQSIPRHAFVTWLAIQKRLMTQDKLMIWIPNEDLKCALGSKCNDSHNHMFFTCEFSKEVWRELFTLLNVRSSDCWDQIIIEMKALPLNKNI